MPDSTTIKIDTGIPMPTTTTRKYPLANMKPGDSFFVPNTKSNGIWGYYRKKNPLTKWASRVVTENDVKGLRVWRLT